MSLVPVEDCVQIIGGGVAGLNCARELHRRSLHFRLSEASDGLGGRMRTDWVDGFRLDRGFQVFQSAYPEAKLALNYASLDLAPLVAGALVRKNSRWTPLVDPIRHPRYAVATAFNRIGNTADRLRLLSLLWNVWRSPVETLTTATADKTTYELLSVDYGFSVGFIETFLRPWLAGIFLEQDLNTSANFFRFVLKMLSSGRLFYPRAGIQAIPDQLAQHLPAESIEVNRSVKSIHDRRIEFADGLQSPAEVVLAVPMFQAALLTAGRSSDRGTVSTTCIYFAADQRPIDQPILMLNGEGDGPVNHVFVMTNASSQIAPPGKVLISVSLVGAVEYASDQVRDHMTNWFGTQVKNWRELAVYRISQALPRQPPGFATTAATVQLDNLVLCGDYCATASLQGALLSGRLAAELVAARRADTASIA